MPEGISPNSLNDISKVYLDQIAAFREVRKQETQKDIERWSLGADPTATQKEEVQVDEEKKALPKLKMYRKAGNLARAGDEKSMKRQTKMVSVLNKETSKGYKKAALDKLRDGGSPKHQTESFSNWRTELREVSDDTPETEKEAEKIVKEKKVKNTVVINPKISEAVAEIGGEVLSIKEGPLVAADIEAGVKEQIEAAVQYFYDEGINEEGIDLLIEEIGLDEFVDFVNDDIQVLNEERAARRANVKAKSYAQVKKEVDTADAARKKSKKGEYSAAYKKKETDVTVYDDKPAAKKKAPAGMKKAVARKKAVLTQPVKKAAPKPKVVKAVAKVKKAQPSKKPTKAGLVSKISTAYKKGMERHKAARERGRVPEKRAKEFGKGFASGVKDTVKFAKKAKKAVVGEEVGVSSSAAMEKARQEAKLKAKEEAAVKKKKALVGEKLDYDPMDDPDFDPREAEKKRGVSGKNNPKGGKKLKDIVKESGWHRRNPDKVGTPADPDFNVLKGKGKPVKDSKPSTTGKASKQPPGIYKPNKEGKFVKVSEDKAFDNVVSALRKKHGKDAVITKDSPKPKAKPLNAKQIWKRDNRDAIQREIDAQYGRTPWNKKGSLGT